MSITVNEAIASEVGRRITVLEQHLATLPFYVIGKKRRTKEAIREYQAHLRGIRAYITVDKMMGIKPVMADELSDEVLGMLASPAMSD